AKDEEEGEHKKPPAAPPADVVADAGNFADKDEGGASDVEAEQHGEDGGMAVVGVGHKPARRRGVTHPMRRGKFHSDPDSRKGDVILPRAGGLAFGGRS